MADIFNIKKGHGRFGFSKFEDKIMFLVSVSDKELSPGLVPNDIDEDKEVLTGFVIHSVEQMEGIGNYFLNCAKYMREKGWFEDAPE